jgi:hypothetical protein
MVETSTTIKLTSMRIIRSFIPLLFFFLPVAAQNFEGSIVFSIKGPQGAQKFEYFTKGAWNRMEFEQAPGIPMVMIVNSTTGIGTILMPQSQAYMEMNIKDAQGKTPAGPDIDIRKTGKKETILGYPCEQILITQGQAEAEMWVTKGLGRFSSATFNGSSGSLAMKKIENELISQGYFPLRMVATQAGQGEMRMEATSVSRKSLSKDLFVVPAGYTKMQMPTQ